MPDYTTILSPRSGRIPKAASLDLFRILEQRHKLGLTQDGVTKEARALYVILAEVYDEEELISVYAIRDKISERFKELQAEK